MIKNPVDFSFSPVEVGTLVELLSSRARLQPHQLAYTFLADRDFTETSLTFGELDHQARRIAALLQSLGSPGARVLLLYPPGLEYISAFFGCLYAGMVCVPAYPPRQSRNLSRLRVIAKDAQASFALITAKGLAELESLGIESPELQSLRWIATDDLSENDGKPWIEPSINRETLAFLQYTSGSTALPKGVMVSHGNVLHNQGTIKQVFGQSERSLIVGWLPLYHDMGLIGNILQPLYLGARAILMSPAAFLQNPFRWLQTISQYKASTSGGPNFAYDLCVRKIGAAQKEMLDLSGWEVAFNGAEPVRPDTLDRFTKAFEPCGFRRESFQPCYGLAESTLLVSGVKQTPRPVVRTFQAKALEKNRLLEIPEGSEDGRAIVSSGAVPREQTVLVVDPESLKRCLPHEVGEIWVAGPSVAQGYWNDPDETVKTFNAQLSEQNEQRFLRTGDLGFLNDGELFIAGRLKDLIIIRGRNHHPQDIERTVEQSHPAMRRDCGAAFSVDQAGEEQLVVVQEVEPRLASDTGEIIERIRDAIADEHEVQVYAVVLIRPRTLPKTSSGKVQRQACRTMFLEGTLKAIAEQRRDPNIEDERAEQIAPPALNSAVSVADWLLAMIAAKLGVDSLTLDVNRPMSSYHLDSLSAVELTHSIQSTLGVDLPLVSLLQDLTVAQLANQLEQTSKDASGSQQLTVEPVMEYPLSQGQEALWFLHEMSPGSRAYFIVTAVRIQTKLDVKALQNAFQKLLERHLALRTTFTASGDHPVQRIQPDMALPFLEEDASGWSEPVLHERLNSEADLPFNLEQGPLLRVRLFTRSAQEHILLLVAHHIVCDFWSLTVLAHELGILYQAETEGVRADLAPLIWQYADFVHWQKEMLAGPQGERGMAYWQKQLAGELPVLDLPLDLPRPLVQTYRGATERFTIGRELTAAIQSLSQVHDATLYATLLAVFQILLYRHTGQDEILVGSPMAGRDRAETAGLVGYFVNPVVLRAHLSPFQTFEQLLEQTRQTVFEALEHQHFPFPLLVERLQPTRDRSRSPLFQSLFVLQKAHLLNDAGLSLLPLGISEARLMVGGLELESVALAQPVAQFDLTLMMAEADGRLEATFIYNADLFDAATIKRLADHFECLVDSIVAHPSSPLSELKLLSDSEYQQLVHEWNQTRAPYPSEALLHQLFEQQVERTPAAIALVFQDAKLTYQELNTRANQLAHYLRRQGVGPESLVGVLMERSMELVVALLGVLKAGAAYVPLEASYPAERLVFMQDDAKLSLLLTQERLVKSLPDSQARVISIDTQWDEIAHERQDNPSVTAAPDNQAYLIYTSGSTGKPKGAGVSHRGFVNLLNWFLTEFNITSSDSILLVSSFSFDLTQKNFYAPLAVGGRLHLMANGYYDADAIRQAIFSKQITLLNCTPSAFYPLLEVAEKGTLTELASLRCLFLGGEPISVSLLRDWINSTSFKTEIINTYGPTECTDICAFHRLSNFDQYLESPVPVGRPIFNAQLLVLDRSLGLVSVGTTGELCVAGTGVGRGYVNDAELTSRKFVPHPFSQETGARLYRTGDLARYRADGEIEFVGRLDDQVKLRGYRIELGEIEAALTELPGVLEAVVLVKTETPDDKYLVAFIVLGQGSPMNSIELRSRLGSRLPEYMIPTFVMLDEIPLTPNGKIDRGKLLAMEVLKTARIAAYVAPRTPVEEMLAEIWAEILGVERVGVDDNFFELGGHSLMATRIATRVRVKLNTEISLALLFDRVPTVAEMANAIEENYIDQSEPEELSEMMKELGELSDEEVRMLLASAENANWD